MEAERDTLKLANQKLQAELDAMKKCASKLKQILPDWHEESDDVSRSNGQIAGEMSWGDVRILKQAIAEYKTLTQTKESKE